MHQWPSPPPPQTSGVFITSCHAPGGSLLSPPLKRVSILYQSQWQTYSDCSVKSVGKYFRLIAPPPREGMGGNLMTTICAWCVIMGFPCNSDSKNWFCLTPLSMQGFLSADLPWSHICSLVVAIGWMRMRQAHPKITLEGKTNLFPITGVWPQLQPHWCRGRNMY